MNFSNLIDRQISADRRRGFQIDFENDAERTSQLEKDLIGLFGEIGEFANILKKVRLKINHDEYKGPSLDQVAPLLREELADALIYLMRLSAILGNGLEDDVLCKMQINDLRYSQLEK